MIKYNLKSACRTIIKDKTYAFINIFGLTVGLASCMLVFTVVIDELSYDKFWKNSQDIYKVFWNNNLSEGFQKRAMSPTSLGQALQQNFPEVENYSAISNGNERLKISPKDPDGIATSVLRADTNVFGILDFERISGKLPDYVAGYRNLLITESFYEKHLGDTDLIGKTIENIPSWSNKVDTFYVAGVIKDIPQNSVFRADAIELEEPDNYPLSKDGFWGGGRVYYKLKSGTDPEAFTAKMNNWVDNFIENPDKRDSKYELQPLQKVYFESEFDNYSKVKGNKNSIYILSGIGVVLLLIACINFVNLSTARAIKRLKETGLRKTLGAKRGQLVAQFLSESMLFFIVSTVLALLIYAVALPSIERFLGHGLSHSILEDLPLFMGCITLTLVVSLITGIYPAWLTSGFNLSNSLKGKISHGNLFTTNGIRKTLVIAQFTMAIFVLIGLFVVKGQVDFLSTKDIGYDKNNLLYIGLRSWDGKGEVFKTELKKKTGIENVSIAGWDLEDGQTSMIKTIDHPFREKEKLEVNVIDADFDFVNTLKFHLEVGRTLDPSRSDDITKSSFAISSSKNSTSILLPTSTAKVFGIEKMEQNISQLNHKPVGVIQDFHYRSLHNMLSPVIIMGVTNIDYAYMYIRVKPGMEPQAQQSLVETWKEVYPNRLLDAKWVTDILDKQYDAEQKQQAIFSFFGGLMLFLSAMGIFGLIVHATQQRIKEIGIRKVLGSSVTSIVTLLSKDFVKLVFVAMIISSPIAWWIMNKWLEDFAYRIDIQWWMFAFAGFIAVAVALITVGYQSIKAALVNPVDSLRNE